METICVNARLRQHRSGLIIWLRGKDPQESRVKKSIAAMHSGARGLFLQHNAFMLQRIGDSADAPRALTSFRGLLIAAGISMGFWAGVAQIFF